MEKVNCNAKILLFNILLQLTSYPTGMAKIIAKKSNIFASKKIILPKNITNIGKINNFK